jgi:hypothetical protein
LEILCLFARVPGFVIGLIFHQGEGDAGEFAGQHIDRPNPEGHRDQRLLP